MDRRTVLKNLALVIGGAILLPSCVRKDGTACVQLKHINIEGDQQTLIADVAETIIPKTTTPGAKDLNLHLFVMKMLDDCTDKKGQEAFLAGLTEFDGMVKKKYDKPFGELAVKDREAVLTGIEQEFKAKQMAAKKLEEKTRPQDQNGKAQQAGNKPPLKPEVPPLNAFYQMMKQQTIFGYTNSKYFMTKEVVYELVPGRYDPHFPVKKTVAV